MSLHCEEACMEMLTSTSLHFRVYNHYIFQPHHKAMKQSYLSRPPNTNQKLFCDHRGTMEIQPQDCTSFFPLTVGPLTQNLSFVVMHQGKVSFCGSSHLFYLKEHGDCNLSELQVNKGREAEKNPSFETSHLVAEIASLRPVSVFSPVEEFLILSRDK